MKIWQWFVSVKAYRSPELKSLYSCSFRYCFLIYIPGISKWSFQLWTENGECRHKSYLMIFYLHYGEIENLWFWNCCVFIGCVWIQMIFNYMHGKQYHIYIYIVEKLDRWLWMTSNRVIQTTCTYFGLWLVFSNEVFDLTK